MSSLDEFFAYVSRSDVVTGIDRTTNTVHVRAANGRIISLVVTPAAAATLAERTGLDFMGGVTRAERSFGLFLVNLDESINSVSGQAFNDFTLDESGGVLPLG